MDEDIRELTALVKQNLALTHDIAHQVHKRRRAAMWGRVFQIIWWVLVIAVSGAAYYYYLEPYVEKALQLYTQVEGTSGQQPGINQDIQRFIQSWQPKQQ